MSAPARHRHGPIVAVTIYRDVHGAWCWASWTGRIGAASAFDSCGPMDDVDGEDGARALVASWWPGAQIVRVPDVPEGGAR